MSFLLFVLITPNGIPVAIQSSGWWNHSEDGCCRDWRNDHVPVLSIHRVTISARTQNSRPRTGPKTCAIFEW